MATTTSTSSPNSVSAQASDVFDQFVSASTLKGVITNFRKICHLLDLEPGTFSQFYPAFKKGITGGQVRSKNWKAQSIFSKIEKKSSNRVYSLNPKDVTQCPGSRDPRSGPIPGSTSAASSQLGCNNVLRDHNCLVVGGGPCGLRTAIELQLLGAGHVTVVEKRDRYSRNNVLHLWPFVITDLKQMAGKKFYGKFCAGAIDHVSIRQLQLMLLKFALILGVEFCENITFDEICPRNLVVPLNINGDVIDLVIVGDENKMPTDLNNILSMTQKTSFSLETTCSTSSLGPNTNKRKILFESSLATSEEVTMSQDGEVHHEDEEEEEDGRSQDVKQARIDDVDGNCIRKSSSSSQSLSKSVPPAPQDGSSGSVSTIHPDRLIESSTSVSSPSHASMGSSSSQSSSASHSPLLKGEGCHQRGYNTQSAFGTGSSDDKDVNHADHSEDESEGEADTFPSVDQDEYERKNYGSSRVKKGRKPGEFREFKNKDDTLAITSSTTTTTNLSPASTSSPSSSLSPTSSSVSSPSSTTSPSFHAPLEPAPLVPPPINGCDSCGCCCHLHESGTREWPSPGNSSQYFGCSAHFSINLENPATSSQYVDYGQMLSKLHGYQFNVVLGADGRRNTLSDYFPRKEFRGKLAIAITANFVNTHTQNEALVPEISGISSIYHQQLFKNLFVDTGIDLENICYYKDDTHYFVMTAKKSSLLKKKVLKRDYADTRTLLSPDNINRTALLNYAKLAAKWTTGLEQDVAFNHYGEPDVAMFDFTSMYAAENACRAKRITPSVGKCSCSTSSPSSSSSHGFKVNTNGAPPQSSFPSSSCLNTSSGLTSDENTNDNNERDRENLLLVGLVGDSLLEPFWPTGSGCARGFLSSMDSAWMVRQWAVKRCNIDNQEDVLSVLKEREAVYRILAQTKSENLSQNYANFTVNPLSRYPNLNSSTCTMLPHQCEHLLYDDVQSPVSIEMRQKMKKSLAEKRARRATIGVTSFSALDDQKEMTTFVNESIIGGGGGRKEILLGSTANLSQISDLDQESKPRFVPGRSRFRELKEAEARNNSFTNSSQDLDDTFADFERNFHDLLEADRSSNGNVDLMSSSMNSSFASTSSTLVPGSDQFNQMHLSPSASNMNTLGKSRAKEIEAALRQRRQLQSAFDRKVSERDATRRHLPLEESNPEQHSDAMMAAFTEHRSNNIMKSKMSWLLDQEQSNHSAHHSNEEISIYATTKRRAPKDNFNQKVKGLEAKLRIASGLPEDEDYDCKKQLAGKGSMVMAAASNLEHLLKPSFQEEKLKEKAKDYRKKTHDIKVVLKMSGDTDWNKKCWEEREKQLEVETKRIPSPENPAPRPKELIDIFKGRKREIEDKIVGDNHPRKETLLPAEQPILLSTRKVKNCDNNWINLLKGELNHRNQKKEMKPPVKITIPFKSPFDIDLHHKPKWSEDINTNSLERNRSWKNNRMLSEGSRSEMESKSDPKPVVTGTNNWNLTTTTTGWSVKSTCFRCKQSVALIDRILISSMLLHRGCLTCAKCGITLRVSEVKSPPLGGGPLPSGPWNQQCVLCSKNMVNSSISSCSSPKVKSTTSSTTGGGGGSFGFRNEIITTKPPVDSLHPHAAAAAPSSRVAHPVASRRPNSLDISNETKSTNSANVTTKSTATDTTSQSVRRLGILPTSGATSSTRTTSLASTSFTHSSSSSIDEYEQRLRERMKWKEQYLQNNNHIDLRPVVKKVMVTSTTLASPVDPKRGVNPSTDAIDGVHRVIHRLDSVPDSIPSSSSTSSSSSGSESGIKGKGKRITSCSNSKNNKKGSPTRDNKVATSPLKSRGQSGGHKSDIKERIDFGEENNSCSRKQQKPELYDDEELTKLLNLESDQWDPSANEDGDEDSSDSWDKSEDSTDNDFDSDEAFDCSEHSKGLRSPQQHHRGKSEKIPPKREEEEEEGIDMESETGKEIDTSHILDSSIPSIMKDSTSCGIEITVCSTADAVTDLDQSLESQLTSCPSTRPSAMDTLSTFTRDVSFYDNSNLVSPEDEKGLLLVDDDDIDGIPIITSSLMTMSINNYRLKQKAKSSSEDSDTLLEEEEGMGEGGGDGEGGSKKGRKKKSPSKSPIMSSIDLLSPEKDGVSARTRNRMRQRSKSKSRNPNRSSRNHEEEEEDTSLSSLSCCDVSGTFDDLDLISMIDDDFNGRKSGLSGGGLSPKGSFHKRNPTTSNSTKPPSPLSMPPPLPPPSCSLEGTTQTTTLTMASVSSPGCTSSKPMASFTSSIEPSTPTNKNNKKTQEIPLLSSSVIISSSSGGGSSSISKRGSLPYDFMGGTLSTSNPLAHFPSPSPSATPTTSCSPSLLSSHRSNTLSSSSTLIPSSSSRISSLASCSGTLPNGQTQKGQPKQHPPLHAEAEAAAAQQQQQQHSRHSSQAANELPPPPTGLDLKSLGNLIPPTPVTRSTLVIAARSPSTSSSGVEVVSAKPPSSPLRGRRASLSSAREAFFK